MLTGKLKLLLLYASMANNSSAPLIVIIGPTGCGKSDIALKVAAAVSGEIVNCDSVQLYRHLDIGTAKVPQSERRGIPHHLVDILDPDQVFTAGDYMQIARKTLVEIIDRGHVPVVVGGTGFYVRALLHGLFTGPTRDEKLRARLERRPERLHRLLRRLDPVSAGRIHANDTQKLIRAVEVCILARRPMTDLLAQPAHPIEGFRTLKIGLDPDRASLNERLHERSRRMFEAGLVEEVRHILAMGYSPGAKALESIGYHEALEYIAGTLTLEDAIEHTQIATRQYAKRQRTWFRREPNVTWIQGFGNQIQTIETAIRLASEFIQNKK